MGSQVYTCIILYLLYILSTVIIYLVVGGNDGQAEDADNRIISRTYMLSIGAGFIAAVFVILILALGIKLTRAQIK